MSTNLERFGEDSQPLLMSRTEDPFYSIRDEVRAQSEQLRIRFKEFKELVTDTDTTTTQFKEFRKDLQRDVRQTDKKLKGLKDAVDMVDKNRAKFAHIKDVELQSRKKFCEDVQVVVDEIKYGMTDDPAIRRKLDDDEQKKRRDVYGSSAAALGGGGVDAEREREKENDTFLRGQARQQKEMIRDQDVQLDHLGRAVDRLGQIGRDVNQELKEQNIMLDGLDKDMNDASDRMDTVMGQMQKLLNSKDGCQIWTIVILALILVILIALVIWLP